MEQVRSVVKRLSALEFDDIDDFDGWSGAPPEFQDGTILNGEDGRPDYSNFRRQVMVDNVDENDYSNQLNDGESASKRVTVTVALKDPYSDQPDEFHDAVALQWVSNRTGMALLY